MILWNLGIYNYEKPECSILPTKEAVDKLKEELATNPEHIVWGPDLSAFYVGPEEDLHKVLVPAGEDEDGNRLYRFC